MKSRAERTLAALMFPVVLCVGIAGCAYNLTPEDERRFEEYRRQNRSYALDATPAFESSAGMSLSLV